MIDRRSLLALAGATAASPALAQGAAPEGAKPAASLLEIQPIWPGKAPGGEKVTAQEQVILRTPGGDPNDTAFLHITDPVLMMRRPKKPNGAAILMIPGGGYVRVAVSKAGGAMDAFEEMEQKVSGMEDRNRAMQDLRKENDFDAQLKDLGRGQALDDAMAALKAKVQGGGGSNSGS